MNSTERQYASDGTYEDLILSDAEQAILTAQIAVAQTAAKISQLQSLLDKSDMVATRCFKASVSFPSEWQTYVAELRAIVTSGTGIIPPQPLYPANT